MRAVRTIILGLTALLGACGVSGDSGRDVTAERAQVRVVQAVTDAPLIDVFATRLAGIPAFPGLPALSASGYVGFDEGDFQFIARSAQGDTLAELDVHLAKFERRVLVVGGSSVAGAVTITSYDDTYVDPGQDRVQLRLVNATLDVDDLSVSVDGDSPAVPIGGEALTNVATGSVRVQTVTSDASTFFTTSPLAPESNVVLAVVGSRSSMSLLVVPPASGVNTTVAHAVGPDPFAVFINGVPGSAAALVVDGVALGSVAFGGTTAPVQVSATPSIALGTMSGALSGALDTASTYLIVLAPVPSATSALAVFAYRDSLASATETLVRAVNVTVGAGARDVALDPAPLLGSDLVFGAASTPVGTLVATPADVTRVTASGTGVLSYSLASFAPTTRYIVLVGDVTSDFGATLVDADWSSTFAPAD